MNKKLDLLKAIMVVILIFVAIMFVTSYATYYFAKANLSTKVLDEFQVQEFSSENCDAVFKALKGGGAGLGDLMDEGTKTRKLLDYAEWPSADFEDKMSLGGGSFMDGADAEGYYAYEDIWSVYVNDERYIMCIQTVTSRYGRENDGVSCIAISTWDHYLGIDREWDIDNDENTVLIGRPYVAKEAKEE